MMTSMEPASEPDINVDPEFQPLDEPDVSEPDVDAVVEFDSDDPDDTQDCGF